MAVRHFFWLYRPTLPSVRAQSIQIIHSAHALAGLGYPVELVAEAAPGLDDSADQDAVLDFYGLAPRPNLTLRILRGGRTKQSLVYRAHAASFVLKHGRHGVLVSRSKKQAVEARKRFGQRATIVLETHELDSALADERGESTDAWVALERAAVSSADAVVANCPGTLALWRERYPLPPAIALQNATRADRARLPTASASGVGYMGSARRYKDMETVIRLAGLSQRRITWIGADAPTEVTESPLEVSGAVNHRDVPDLLSSFRVLLLPLSSGVFGEKLCSPLKLWDYMAAGVPIVGANVGSLNVAAPGAFWPYDPGDAESLHRAVECVYTDESARKELLEAAFIRTWEQRATEFDTFLREAL